MSGVGVRVCMCVSRWVSVSVGVGVGVCVSVCAALRHVVYELTSSVLMVFSPTNQPVN